METEDDSGSPQPGTKVYRRFSGWGWPVMGFVMIFNAVEQFQVNYGRSADGVATRLHDIDWAVVSSLVGVVVGILFVIRPERVAALPEGLAMWGWFGRRRGCSGRGISGSWSGARTDGSDGSCLFYGGARTGVRGMHWRRRCATGSNRRQDEDDRGWVVAQGHNAQQWLDASQL